MIYETTSQVGTEDMDGTASLLRTRRVHLEEGGVQEQVQHFFLPGPLRVGVAAQRAQQLGARPEAGHVVGTKGGRQGKGEGQRLPRKATGCISHNLLSCTDGGYHAGTSPVVAQVREHVVEQAGDQRHGFLLLVAAVDHVQERRQNLERGCETREIF